MTKPDRNVQRILDVLRAENPDMTDEEFEELSMGIIEMGVIAYQKTQEGKIFITDDPTNTH